VSQSIFTSIQLDRVIVKIQFIHSRPMKNNSSWEIWAPWKAPFVSSLASWLAPDRCYYRAFECSWSISLGRDFRISLRATEINMFVLSAQSTSKQWSRLCTYLCIYRGLKLWSYIVQLCQCMNACMGGRRAVAQQLWSRLALAAADNSNHQIRRTWRRTGIKGLGSLLERIMQEIDCFLWFVILQSLRLLILIPVQTVPVETTGLH
jgi:hypothetical protein